MKGFGCMVAGVLAAAALTARADNRVIYKDVIAPIFEAKCTKCHGPEKAKAKLRLNTHELVMKGGENGKCIKPGDGKGSRMVKQFHLPESDDAHMPPTGKPQLSAAEIAAITWWIDKGASATMKLSEAGEMPADAKAALK